MREDDVNMGNKPRILAIYGKSASGKDTYMGKQLEAYPSKYNKIMLVTSRPPREGEQDGINYLFKKKKEILKNDDFLWPIDYNNWLYAIDKTSLKEDKINIGVFNSYWMKKLFEDKNIHFNLAVIKIVTPDKERLLRSLNREENPDCKEICRRFLADEADFSDIDFVCAEKEFFKEFPNKTFICSSDSEVIYLYNKEVN